MNTITTVPDFLTKHVDSVLNHTQGILARPGGSIPALRYFRNGEKFSLPISYEHFVKIGEGMRKMATATTYIARVGTEFAFYAAEIADRSEDPIMRLHDQISFIHEIGHILYHIQPQAYSVTMPVKVVLSPEELDRLMRLTVGGVPQASEPNAILVSGCNRVRSYSLICPFSAGRDGRFVYAEPKVYDSLLGAQSQDTLFQGIYEPSRN